MSKETRLDKVERHLTTKQAVILWLQEAHQQPSMLQYTLSRRQADKAKPLARLASQVEHAVRDAMRGQKSEAVDRVVQSEIKDLCFLFRLHLQANYAYLEERRLLAMTSLWLLERLHAIRLERIYRSIFVDNAGWMNRELSYPVDAGTAAAVEAAREHHVTTFEQLEDMLDEWLYQHLVEQGARELPEDCYQYSEGKRLPRVDAGNEEQIRECFPEEAEFERFRSGADYHHWLAGVTDAGYIRHHERMVTAMRDLVTSKKVQAGTVLYLEIVPIPFLTEAPLVDGKWLDSHTVALAEWGVTVRGRGYQPRDDDVCHDFQVSKFVDSDGKEATPAELQRLRRTALRRLARFPGRTRKIDGRLYVSFADYCSWRGRKVKGNLRDDVQEGFLTASWNRWVDSGSASLAGVSVEKLQDSLGVSCYHVRKDPSGEVAARERMLESMCALRLAPERQTKLLNEWREPAERLLRQLHGFQDAVAAISRQYYDGHDVLFRQEAAELALLVHDTEATVRDFNKEVEACGQSGIIDLQALRTSSAAETHARMDSLVTMAKVEALKDVGETEKAVQLLEGMLTPTPVE